MPNHDNPSERPVERYQSFLDATLGSEFIQAMEEGHANRVLEAIDYAEDGNYIESSASFLMACSTAPTSQGKQYCKDFAQLTSDAHSAFETTLSNAASEAQARRKAKAVWRQANRDLSIYLSFLGVYFSERGKHNVAIQYYDRALEFNPRHAMAYFSRGNAKIDLRLYSEAIPDLEQAAQLFQIQNDLTNYRNAVTILENLKNYKIQNYGRSQSGDQQRQITGDKEIGNSSEMITNAAHYQAFTIQLKEQFPQTSEDKRQEIAAGMLYKYLSERYNSQKSQYTEVDREFFKAICFHQGLNVEKISSKRESRKSFLIGFVVGGLAIYTVLKLL